MIVLKNLSNDYNVDPYPLRVMLRKQFGKRARWRWDENSRKEMADLKKIRTYLDTTVATKDKQV